MRQCSIHINPTALSHNLHRVRQLASNAKVLAMVKANAYGHGLALCLATLKTADAIGLACFSEAEQARQLGWSGEIVLIEGVFSREEWAAAIHHQCQCVIHNQQQLQWALEQRPPTLITTRHHRIAMSSRGVYFGNSGNYQYHHICMDGVDEHPSRTVWLKYNTGMNRLGFGNDAIIFAAQQLHQAGYRLILTSHFANADDASHPMNQQQGSRFAAMLRLLKQQVSPDIHGSLCNSAGIVNFPNWHYDWVRPGIMLYGSSPVINHSAQQLQLQPVMTLAAALMAVHDIAAGETVGYGSRWMAAAPSRIGVVSMGYGDGYPRVVDDSTWVGLMDDRTGSCHRCPIRGRVAMDMLVIDLSGVPEGIALGSRVILWGDAQQLSSTDANTHATSASSANSPTSSHLSNVPHIDEVAAHAGTISYELLCRLTGRPARQATTPYSVGISRAVR